MIPLGAVRIRRFPAPSRQDLIECVLSLTDVVEEGNYPATVDRLANLLELVAMRDEGSFIYR